MVVRKEIITPKLAEVIQKGDQFDIGGIRHQVIDVKSNQYGDKVFTLYQKATKRKSVLTIDRKALLLTTGPRK